MPARAPLARNSLWMILSRFGVQGLSILFTVVLARRLGSAGFGEYAFIAALIYVANSLTTFGTDMVLIREIAARDDMSRLPSALAIQLLLSALLIGGTFMFGARIPNQSTETVLALRIYVLSLIPLAFFTVFTTALRGQQRMREYAVLSAAAALLQAAIVLVPGIDLVRLCALLFAVQGILATLAGWMCRALIPIAWRSGHTLIASLPSLLRACAPFALLTVLGMAYQRLGIYLLSTMSGATNTGLYSAAARTVEASKTVHLAVFAVMYPAMALLSSQRTSHGELGQSIRISRNLLLAGGIVEAAVLFTGAVPLMHVLYGAGYQGSAPILRVLAWTLIPFTLNSYLTLSFIAARRELLVGRALLVSLLGALFLNLWLIPAWGALGSAWAALAGECLQSVVLLSGLQPRSVAKGATHELSDLAG